MSKALFLLFGVVLLAQYCVARPDGEFEVKDEVSVRNYVRGQARDLAMKTIHNAKNWLEEVHKEIDNLTQKDERTQALDRQIVEFLAKANTLSSLQDEKLKWDRMNKIFVEVVRLSFKYTYDVNEHDPEMKSLADLLKRNGMDAFHDQFVVDCEQTGEKVFAAIEQYVNSLSSTEKEQEENIHVIRALNRYNNAQGFKQKIEVFLRL